MDRATNQTRPPEPEPAARQPNIYTCIGKTSGDDLCIVAPRRHRDRSRRIGRQARKARGARHRGTTIGRLDDFLMPAGRWFRGAIEAKIPALAPRRFHAAREHLKLRHDEQPRHAGQIEPRSWIANTMSEAIQEEPLDDAPGRRHQPSAGPRSSHAAGLPFAAYVTGTRQRITAAVADLDAPPSAAVIEQRLPFELLPNPARASLVGDGRFTKAVLLIHGLLDTPFIMRDIAARFAEQGYLVRAVLLPGHGTRPGDLLAVGYREWIDAVAYGIDGLSEKLLGELTLVGFSLGATLAVHQALRRPAPDGVRIKALVMLSPAFRAHGRAVYWCNGKTRYRTEIAYGRRK